jgi:hypothetical protein
LPFVNKGEKHGFLSFVVCIGKLYGTIQCKFSASRLKEVEVRVMAWNSKEYPEDMRHLSDIVRRKAIEIANKLLAQGVQDTRAIPIAISQAREWHRNTRASSPVFISPRR